MEGLFVIVRKIQLTGISRGDHRSSRVVEEASKSKRNYGERIE